MNAECTRIADQLRRAFSGDAWHGPPLSTLLSAVSSTQASDRPIASAHTIWELVVHIDLYVHAALKAIGGTPIPKWYGTERDWPPVTETSESAWKRTTDRLFQNAEQLSAAIEAQQDSKLQDTVPGREYDFYFLFHGIVQHSLYHGGQIALLEKA